MKRMRVTLFTILIMGLTILLNSRESTAGTVQWLISSGGNGHYYEVFVDTNAPTWLEKYNHAISQGGYLATITSAAENEFVFSISKSSTYWYTDRFGIFRGPTLGGIQQPSSSEPLGGWGWVTSEPFNFAAWASGQPNNASRYGNQDRIEFWNQNSISSSWQDVSQTALEPGISWIVEYEQNPVVPITGAV